MFARFAGIGVGHLAQHVRDQHPALSLEAGEESEDEEDVTMQDIDEGQTADQVHEDSVDGEEEEGEGEEGEEESSQASEDEEGSEEDESL